MLNPVPVQKIIKTVHIGIARGGIISGQKMNALVLRINGHHPAYKRLKSVQRIVDFIGRLAVGIGQVFLNRGVG